jgi:hypothetical protein
VVTIHLVDDLRTQNLGLCPILHLHTQSFEHGTAGVLDLALSLRMKLQHPEMPFYHHESRPDIGCLYSRIGYLIDQDTRRDLNKYGSHTGDGDVTSGIGAYIGGKLGLQSIQVDIGTKFCHTLLLGEVDSLKDEERMLAKAQWTVKNKFSHRKAHVGASTTYR